MAMILSCSIDLGKIDKTKITEHKNGGKYYNFTVVVNDDKDQYGNDVAISAQQTEEQRKAKEKRTFIGNGKKVWEGKSKQASPQTTTPTAQSNGGDGLPF